MKDSLQIRKEAWEAKQRDRELIAAGKLRPEQISLAASFGTEACQGPITPSKRKRWRFPPFHAEEETET